MVSNKAGREVEKKSPSNGATINKSITPERNRKTNRTVV
jgi:hypothetical protein